MSSARETAMRVLSRTDEFLHATPAPRPYSILLTRTSILSSPSSSLTSSDVSVSPK